MNNTQTADCVYLLSEQTDSQLYISWLDQLKVRWQFVEQYDESWEPPSDAAIVVTHHHYRLKEAAILQRLMQDGSIPVLILADGILEYRNTFEHPQIAAGAVFQPLLGHKLACIGSSQARVVEAWNARGCCEVVGLPRLDRFPVPNDTTVREGSRDDGEFRILIASARQPGFTRQQQMLVLEGFSDVRRWLASHKHIGTRRIRPIWRLTGDLASELRIDASVEAISEGDLDEELGRVDAVVTTPSTLALEAMRFGIPVALMDYTNSPHYVSAAWDIRAKSHLDTIVRELSDPPAAKMLFQNTTLFDALECRSPAAPRMCALIHGMIDAAKGFPSTEERFRLPENILYAVDYSCDPPLRASSVGDLHANSSLIQYGDNTDLELLASHQEAEIAHLLERIHEIGVDAQDAARARRQLEQTIDYFEFKRSRVVRFARLLAPKTMWFPRAQSDSLVIANINEWLSFLKRRLETSGELRQCGASLTEQVTPAQRPSGVMRALRSMKRNCQENYRKRARMALQFGTTNYWSPRRRRIYFPPSI